MMKTLTAIGISAAIVFAPLAAIAQTDTRLRPPALPRPPTPGAAADSMKKPAKAKHKKHMRRQEGQEAGGGRRRASRSGRSAEELSLQRTIYAEMSRPIPRMGRFFVSDGRVAFAAPAPMANSRGL